MRKKTFDRECYAIASSFLSDVRGIKQPITDEVRNELAEAIQQTIEDFISALYEAEQETVS